ncbi:acyl-CoA carboxylase subunit epsilon [Protofrankia symbiont of Coriaria ruscifolia]|uniref:Acyl-CoA carboxylase subunit epsilon n=1 Tax=Candidatus Protofrankia californiensis TaxID=1839754 RepID=A0A1C3NVU2_9ACTN|nr:acyl-CoA carboxylase subunit epsilon [Protofrankia symbiont of Coriaria ruscifolia]SBW19892.1 hypothetical protein FDG2_1532 [Candidatus Protofrankia californiensis]
MDSGGDGRAPHLRVVPTNASAEEIAALVAVLCLREAAPRAPQPPPSGWTDRSTAFRQSVHSGPDVWRRTGFTQGIRTRADW